MISSPIVAVRWFDIPAAAIAGDAAAGKVIFDTNCMTCHGMTGKGDGPAGTVLDPPPRDFSVGDFRFDADGFLESWTIPSREELRRVVKKTLYYWLHTGTEDEKLLGPN